MVKKSAVVPTTTTSNNSIEEDRRVVPATSTSSSSSTTTTSTHNVGGGLLLLPSHTLVIVLFIITLVVGIFTFKAQQESTRIGRELSYRQKELMEAESQLDDRRNNNTTILSITTRRRSKDDNYDATIMEEIINIRNDIAKLNEIKYEYDKKIEMGNGNISYDLSNLVKKHGSYMAYKLKEDMAKTEERRGSSPQQKGEEEEEWDAYYDPDTFRTVIRLSRGKEEDEQKLNDDHHQELKNWMLDHVIDRIGLDVNIMSSYHGDINYQIDILRLTLLRLLSPVNKDDTISRISNWVSKCIHIALDVNANAEGNYEEYEYLIDRNDNIARLRDEVIEWKEAEHVPKSAVWAAAAATTA